MSFFGKLWQKLRFIITKEFLCDTCRYDYKSACRRPERPNATVCPDYKKK